MLRVEIRKVIWTETIAPINKHFGLSGNRVKVNRRAKQEAVTLFKQLVNIGEVIVVETVFGRGRFPASLAWNKFQFIQLDRVSPQVSSLSEFPGDRVGDSGQKNVGR